jgi:hypothetical protein
LSKQQLELPPDCQNSVILVFGGRIGNPPDPDMAKSIGICPHLVVRNVIPHRILKNTVIKPAIFTEEARMCLKVQEPWPMPQETAMVGRATLKEDSPYHLIGEKMFDKFHEQD